MKSFQFSVVLLICAQKPVFGFGVLGDTGLPNSNFFDDQICLSNFDVSEGSIIRTKDSLALGARYLNVSELGDGKAKDDCLRLCCKTPRCNVITFEEKRSGSCYLFDCGSIDNFNCKFTDQPEFMSAILRKRVEPIMSMPPQVQNPINRHEVELSQLRNTEADPQRPSSSRTLETEELVGKEKSSNFSFNLDKPDTFNGGSRGHCSRYQFECKSSGECIGIYNACDGIAQCPDGSDEAVELNCPSVNGRPGIVENKGEVKQIPKSEPTNGGGSTKSQIHQELHATATQTGKGGTTGFQVPPGTSAQSNGPPNIFTHKDNGLIEDSSNNQLLQQRQNNPYNYWKSYDYGLADPAGIYGQGQQRRNPPFYNNMPVEIPLNPGNFNGQLKFPAYGDIPSMPYNPNMPMLPQLLPPYNNARLGNGPANPPYANVGPQTVAAPKTEATTMKPLVAVASTNAVTTAKPVLTTPNPLANPSPPTKLTQKEIDDKILASLLNHASQPVPQLDIGNYGVVIESEAADIPAPGAGAVLAFVTGMVMAIVMVSVITCRLRRVRISSRRRGKNRLDPDYLVDGMYL